MVLAEHDADDFVYDLNLLLTKRCIGLWESTCSNIIEAAAASAKG